MVLGSDDAPFLGWRLPWTSIAGALRSSRLVGQAVTDALGNERRRF